MHIEAFNFCEKGPPPNKFWLAKQIAKACAAACVKIAFHGWHVHNTSTTDPPTHVEPGNHSLVVVPFNAVFGVPNHYF